MVIAGRVENGVVVLAGGASLPEGTEVSVLVAAAPRALSPAPECQKQRVELPLVRSGEPGTFESNERTDRGDGLARADSGRAG